MLITSVNWLSCGRSCNPGHLVIFEILPARRSINLRINIQFNLRSPPLWVQYIYFTKTLMVTIRKAHSEDLDFLVDADLLSDGSTLESEDEIADHREKISAFVVGTNDMGWIAQDDLTGEKAGMILVRFRDRFHEPVTEANLFLFRFLDAAIFPEDGRFCEIFQLYVTPAYRRQGIATQLKQQTEIETRQRSIKMIYTHTESKNEHVIDLNRKLGYQVVRCGPLWDDILRTSLVKWLE